MKRIKIGINKLITSTKKQLKKIKKEHLIRQLISLTGFTEEQVEGL